MSPVSRYRRLLSLCLILSLFAQGFLFGAEEDSLPLSREALSREPAFLEIGLTLAQVWEREAPREVYSLRGNDPFLDDVVLFYGDYHYFYLYGNRVWQIRWDCRFEGTLAGLSLGMSPDEVVLHWGEADERAENSWFYVLEDRGWPQEARLVFDENEEGESFLTDIYVYRGDL